MNHRDQNFISVEQTSSTRAWSDNSPFGVPGVAGALPDASNSLEHKLRACELHDAISQTLFAANLLAGTLAQTAGDDANVRGQAKVLERLNRSALSELRLMLFELQPEVLYSVRMPELLQRAAEALEVRGDMHVQIDIDDSSPLCAEQRIDVYRITQAALSNIARHSGARQAQLRWFAPLDGPASLRISDDGQGLSPDASTELASGINRIRAHASRLGANLIISSLPGAGTELILTIHRKGTST